jgi:hypothetical protein
MGGYLVSGAIANACYPQVDGGSKLLFRIFSLDPGENVANGILQEFVFRKLTPSAKDAN